MRCGWVKTGDATYEAYHDKEWGKPLHDEQALFELFSLETQAAGLSWLTVLKKRDAYRAAFAGFDMATVASFTCKDITQILQHDVIRNTKKLEAIIHNARLFQQIQQEVGSISTYFWSWVNHVPIVNDVPHFKAIPTTSPLSDALTKDLKKRGFKFVGSVTLYAFMQACGMVNDHENGCDEK